MILLIVARYGSVLLRAIWIHEIKAALTEQVGHTASLGEWMSKSRLYASIFSGLQIKKMCFPWIFYNANLTSPASPQHLWQTIHMGSGHEKHELARNFSRTQPPI